MSAQPRFQDQPPNWMTSLKVFARYLRLRASALAEKIGRRIPKLRGLSRRKLLYLELFVGVPLLAVVLLACRILFFLYLDPRGLPDIESLVNFQPLSIGEIQDSRGEVLVELAREYRRVVDYKDMPPVVIDAILAAEDKRFFRHHGVDYLALPRVALRTLTRTKKGIGFSQGGSTVTQQLVRVYFLPHLTSRENRDALLRRSLLARLTSLAIGPRATNKLIRKAEEIRISLWLERQMKRRFGSRRAAKEQILARYASVVYLGHGRHGFAAASEYYFGVPLSSYTKEDADKAALLAGLAKAPEDYAPTPD
ncbi:MAG TPA: biosynthetic peptidoglycan transglycosylase, partial [Thermoanaerobaculia bacterium]|nr:biosynthetic peptidoglycan transglycosylase [Thermoanaerobaculia bacterium]